MEKTIEQEQWRMIEGYHDYAVSNFGRVISLNSAKYIRQTINPKGYCRVHLPGRKVLVHRLVAGAFLPPPTVEQTQINHKNGDTGDNRLINLEWCTASENLKHAYKFLGRKAATEGKHLPKEVRDKISRSNRGRKFSYEVRMRNSIAHKGKQCLGDNPRARETICLETGEKFACAKSAAIKFGVKSNSILQSVHNGSRVDGKYHFSFIN